MKGDFDDDDRISGKDAEKKTHLDQILVYFLQTIQILSPFACLLIGVNQEARGTALDKEKKRKRNNLSYCTNEKYFW